MFTFFCEIYQIKKRKYEKIFFVHLHQKKKTKKRAKKEQKNFLFNTTCKCESEEKKDDIHGQQKEKNEIIRNVLKREVL